MKISACVIVKNEEKNIGQWLNNMRQIADEIIVVDTGSTDNTLNILENANITPYHFTWCNDFAAAKNYAIQQATGDWIAFLDADEYFDASSVQRFRTEMTRYHANKKIGAIMCQLVNIDTDNRNKIIDTMIQVRIFRNSKDIYYKNPVHEQLVTKPGKYIMQKCFDLQIIHTGYSAGILRKKAERDLPILQQREKEAKTQQEREQLYVFFMDAYNCLGVFDKVLLYAQKAVKSNMKTLGGDIHVYECMISAMIHLGKDDKEIMAVIQEARKKFPREVFFAVQLGYYYYVGRDYLQAEQYLLEARRLRQFAEKDIRAGKAVSDTSLNLMPMLYSSLGDIYICKGQKQQALELAIEGLGYYKYNRLLVQVLYKSLQGKSALEVIQIFACIFDRKKDGDFLMEAIGWQATGEFTAYYYPIHDTGDKTKLYIKTKKYQGGAAVAGQQLDLLNHSALAEVFVKQENGEETLPSVFAIMPDKYQKLSMSKAECQQDVDGRAAIRLRKQMKYYE
mgnify:FL=1